MHLKNFCCMTLAIAIAGAASSSAEAGLLQKLFGKESSCCEPVCCEPEPVCCEPACCAAEPVCCEPEPCCASVDGVTVGVARVAVGVYPRSLNSQLAVSMDIYPLPIPQPKVRLVSFRR